MHYRKKSSTTNSLSNDFDKNELTTYTYCSRKTNLNDSYFTSISDKKDKDKDKSIVNSIRSSRENLHKEMKRASESEEKERAKTIEREVIESESGEIRAKSNDIHRITNNKSNIQSFIKINKRREANRNRPPLPTQNLTKPSKTPDTKKLSLQEKLFNYVEARLNERNRSSEVKTEGSQTTSEKIHTTESEENININRSYFSFKGNDSLVSPVTPNSKENPVYQKSQKRSNSKIFNTIKKLTSSFRPFHSEGDANQDRIDINTVSDKFDNPKIRFEKVIRISRRINRTEESRESNRYNTNYTNESEQDAKSPSIFVNKSILNSKKNSEKIKTITINKRGVISLAGKNQNDSSKKDQSNKVKQISRIQATIRGYLFRLRLFHKVIRRKYNKQTYLAKVFHNYDKNAQIEILKKFFKEWSNKKFNDVKLINNSMKNILMKLFNIYKISSDKSKSHCLNKFFKEWLKRISNLRRRDGKLFEIIKNIRKKRIKINFQLWKRIKNIFYKRSPNYNLLTILIKLKIFFITKNFQNQHIFFQNLRMRQTKSKKREDDIKSFYDKFTNLQKNKKKSCFTNLLFKIKIISLQMQMQNRIFKNIFHKFDKKKKSQVLKRILDNWIKIIFKFNRSNIFSEPYKYKEETEVITNLIKSNQIPRINKSVKFSLLKLILNLSNKNKIRIDLFFLLWKKKIIKNKFEISSISIQKFLRAKMKLRLVRDNSFQIEKLSYRSIVYLKGSEKLINTIRKLVIKYTFNKIQREVKSRMLIKFVIKLKNLQLRNFQYSFRKIKRFVQIKTIMTNAYARKIQKFYRMLKYRKGILFYIMKLKCLKKNVCLLTDKNFGNLNKSIKHWKRISMKNKWEDSALVIQSYLRKKLEKKFIQKQKFCKECVYKIFRDYLVYRQIKPFFKQFNQNVRIGIANQHIKRHYEKYFLDNFRLKCELGKFGRMLIWVTERRKEFLKESLKRIKNHWDGYEKIQSTRKIQKFYKLKLIIRRKEKIQTSLYRIFNRIHYTKSNFIRNFFSKWLKNSKNLKILINAQKITNFISKKLTEIKYRKIWKSFEDKMILKYTLKSLKIICFLKKLIKPFIKRNLQKIKINHSKKIRKSFLLRLMNKFFNKNCNLILQRIFADWRLKAESLNTRDESIFNMLEIFTQLQGKISSFYLISSLKLNSLRLVLQKKILTKSFLKIQTASENRLIFLNLCKKLVKAEENIEINLKKTLKKNIYRLFTYKVINSFMNLYRRKEKIEDLKQSKLFLTRLKENLIEFNNYTNIIRHRFKSVRKSTKLNFSDNLQSIKSNMKDVNKRKKVEIFLIPILKNLFVKLKKNRSQKFFTKLNFVWKISKFIHTLNSVEKNLFPSQEFFQNLLKISQSSKLYSNFVEKIIETSKKKFLINLILSLKRTNKITKLMYVIQLTKMHKKIADYKFIQVILRKWAFYSHMKILSRKKLSIIYQNLNSNYETASKEIFNEQNDKNEYNDYKNIFDIYTNQFKLGTYQNAEFEY